MQTSTNTPAHYVSNPTPRAMVAYSREWHRANDAGEGFAGGAHVDEIVLSLLCTGSDRLVLVEQGGRFLACGRSYDGSWCADVTKALAQLADDLDHEHATRG